MGETLKRKCCCGNCMVGAVIPKWVNVTLVRPPGGSGGNVAPYVRQDQVTWNAENPGNLCSAHPAGFCGGWIAGGIGDLNGFSEQIVTDTVDDIIACAAPDSTHVTSDHNCYHQSGMVDMSAAKLFGAQWVFARKYWHGNFGWLSKDAGCPDPNVPPDQVRYRTVTVSADRTVVPFHDFDINKITIKSSAAGSRTVNRLTGIMINGIVTTETAVSAMNSGRTTYYSNGGAGYTQSDVPTDIPQVFLSGLTTNVDGDMFGSSHCNSEVPTVQDYVTSDSIPTNINGWSYHATNGTPGTTGYSTIDIVVTRSNTVYTWSIKFYYYAFINPSGYGIAESDEYNGSLTLSDPYTSAQCMEDFKTLLAAWGMSDVNLAKFRMDGTLASAPLVVYDEIQTASLFQGFIPATMNDLSGTLQNDKNGNVPGSHAGDLGQHDDNGQPPGPDYTGGVDYQTTWSQRPWIDPHDFIWKYPNGSYGAPTGFTGGASLLTPRRTGQIISHNQVGSDRHFWFGSAHQTRDPGSTDWFTDTHGETTPGTLPPVAMRWMDNFESQYDGAHPHPGNYPQAWWTEINGVLRGGKFVQSTSKLPSVNFGRPCGPDKFAIDQPTVCCVNVALAGGVLTVKKTGNAIAPLAAGGLAVNDYILYEGLGTYKISSITATAPDSDGNPQWIVGVGALIDGSPTGFSFAGPDGSSDGATHIGRLRWPSSPGICGRAAITAAFAAGTVTIMPAAALPYLRLDPVAGNILVDVYDSNMGLLVSGASLTRVNDSSFTFINAAIPTAAWMTGHGVDWTKYDSSSKKTAMRLNWAFNPRPAQAGYTGVIPTWYAGVPGCLGCTVTQFNYSAGACPAVVGIVPFHSPAASTGSTLPPMDNPLAPGNLPVENFPNQILFDFDGAVVFDDVYGGHWQSAVMLSMPDPFWQQPFKPDCAITSAQSMNWTEDDGTGQLDHDDGTTFNWFYAHRPLVEALANIPPGDSLPAGVSLTYANPVIPPFYPNGIPIGDPTGGYGSFLTDWVFDVNACADIGGGGRFHTFYQTFVSC